MIYTEEWVTARAREAYEQGQASFGICPERSALLVIDMQDEFVRPGWSPYWVPAATRMAPRLRRLVHLCRDLGVPVIWSIFDDTHLGLDRPYALRHLPHADTDWRRTEPAEVRDEMGYRSDEVLIRKPSYGASYDTPLDTIRRNLGRDTVIVTGTLTNYACCTTTQQAYERGYRVVFGGTSLPPTTNPGRSPNLPCCARDSRSCRRPRRSWIGCPARTERTQPLRETVGNDQLERGD
ncbi:isochorismatase family cysteine hydrolase [Streptomyces sp. DG2A-72]|uniref:isochorismatase family cysteine hydrolase n=1 Tax=Streptomyces sp. DG2A-72 TaxID=3051386 RepID=UPI00265C3B2F|nr:isochorismatase family cysteine hydrolase [Streptomyces sp. DG2A-72]MDO0933915.1 isochorismatase family cysteine hydrolase [Streptomyces sp. DG2A-72]